MSANIEGSGRPSLVRVIGSAVREIPASPEARKKTRVSVFIDGDNLYHSLKRLGVKTGDTDFDFRTVLDILGEGKQIIEALYFTAPAPTPSAQEAQNRFLLGLSKIGIGSFTIPSNKAKEDNPKDPVDHYIIQEMGIRYRKCDEVILVSGDGHFNNIVRRLLGLRRKVIVVASDGDLHRDLRGSGAKIIDLAAFAPGFIGVKPIGLVDTTAEPVEAQEDSESA